MLDKIDKFLSYLLEHPWTPWVVLFITLFGICGVFLL